MDPSDLQRLYSIFVFSAFFFNSIILVIGLSYFVLPSITPSSCHCLGHTELPLITYFPKCSNSFYENSSEVHATALEASIWLISSLGHQGLLDIEPSFSLS